MTLLIGLSQNIALLLALIFIYGLLSPRIEQLARRAQDVVRGVVFGLFAAISMTLPIQLQPGLFLDGRTLVIIISGMYGGPVSAIISTVIVSVYRMILGGIGVPGGLAGAFTAAVLGITLHYRFVRQGTQPNAPVLILAGAVQALLGSVWNMLISRVNVEIIAMSLPATIILYPLGLLMLSTLIKYQQRSRELEHKLREDERRFRAIFDTSFQLTMLFKPDGTVLEANRAVLGFAQIGEEKLPGRIFWETSWWSQTAEQQRQQLRKAFERAASGEVIRFETEISDASHQKRTFDFSIRPISGSNGTVEMILFEGRDITTLKELEAQKMDLQMERERAHLLKKFISDVSHDLRTPLAVMRLNLELLRRSNDPAKQPQRVETLAAQEQHLTRLLTDMMTMLSLDDEQSAFHFKHIDPYFVAQMVLDSHHTAAQNKKQMLTFNRALDPVYIRADQVELERALSKLVTNAINYTPAEGTITLSVFRENESVVIELCDTGIGISAADLPHIFERFFRADQARSIDTGGAGLGLSIVNKIVEAHGGKMEVASIVGEGSTFRLLLPLVPADKLERSSDLLPNR